MLSPEDMEREEIRTVKEILKVTKQVMDKNPLHKVYISISDLDRLFPSYIVDDRFDESVLNNVRKYFHHYNKRYCNEGFYYYVGTARSIDGEKVVFIQQLKKEKSVQFKIVEEATIDTRKYNSGKGNGTIGGISTEKLFEKLSEEGKEKISNMREKVEEEENT